MVAQIDSRQLRRIAVYGVLLVFAVASLMVGAACGAATSAAGQPAATTAPAESGTTAARGGGAATAPKPAAPKAPDAKPADSKPANGNPAAQGTGRSDAERERIAARATWAPGQLDAHFEKHGEEGPYRTVAEYDRAARETIRTGTPFTYQDRESNARRQGYYDKAGNRFTGVTRDGARITTHFRPNRGEAYVRGLEESTYR